MATRTAGLLHAATDDEALLRVHPVVARALPGASASSVESGKTASLVVIHRQPLFRDCLVRCLEQVHQSCVVLAFPSLREWFASAARHPAPAAIVAFVSGKNSIEPELRREFAQFSASK